ncbi:MAG: hypothetical protein CMN76_13975 [Spirochaetaceae bacterium]|nr:hypothetical protein [Spirochaetaceae bacterium]
MVPESEYQENEKKLKRLHMLVPDSEWRHLKELADRRQVSVSELVRSAYQDLYWPRSRLRALQILDRWDARPPISQDTLEEINNLLERRPK